MSDMISQIVSKINLSNSIYKSSLNSLVSIYEDSEVIRKNKIDDIHIIIEKWSFENQDREESDRVPFCKNTFDDLNHYQYHVDYLLMNSLFLSAFSMFEHHLKQMVEVSSSLDVHVIKPYDIRGRGEIDTLRKYLNLVVGIKSANSGSEQWKEILAYKAIRNSIVHSGSILNLKKQKNLFSVCGYDLLIKYKIWYRSDRVYFRLRNIDFLKGFLDISCQFTESIIDEFEMKT